jgi:hypothetical protein
VSSEQKLSNLRYPEVVLPSRKDDDGKWEPTLVYRSFMRAVAKTRRLGVETYSDSENWRGVSDQRYLDAALRHLFDYLEGEAEDASGNDHLGAAACCLMFVLERRERGPEPNMITYRRKDTK